MRVGRISLLALAVLVVALLLNLAIGAKFGLSHPMESDSFYYRHLAENLAAGKGYVATESFWPGEPSMRRLPGWPFFVSIGLRLAPGASPDAVMRVMGILVGSAVCMMLFLLTQKLFGSTMAGLLAALGYGIHPSAIHATLTGLSEPLFILLAVSGLYAVLWAGAWRLIGGAMLLGLACLVRANFVLLPGFLIGLVVLYAVFTGYRPTPNQVAVAGLLLVLFVTPVTLWALRNYHACGHFPVISTLRGQTFYGGNNDVVAQDLRWWGYWVFPDQIPGETPMCELATTMSEYEVDAYYTEKGRQYVRTHMRYMPRLWLGKLVRGFVPVPWSGSLGSYAVCAFRFLLYAAAIVGAWLSWRRLHLVYRFGLVAMIAISALTVLVFWGCARFAFSLEPFLLPLAADAAVCGVPRLRQVFRKTTTTH